MSTLYSKVIFLFALLGPSFAWGAKSPIYSCPGPNACILTSYEGLVFPDGTQQSTAAGGVGGVTGIGTIDSEMSPSANGGVVSGVDLIFQSASATVPGLVNNSAQTMSGAKTFSSSVVAGASGSTATNVVVVLSNGHLKSTQSSVPTAAPNANAGTGATCAVTHATDVDGIITLVSTATLPALGAQCAVTFNRAYNVAPVCVFSAAGANSALFGVSSGVFFTSSTTVLTVNFAAADAAGHSYVWNYHCEETQ